MLKFVNGPYGFFKNPVCCKISKELEKHFENILKFSKKKTETGAGKVSKCQKIGEGDPSAL